MNFVNSEIFKVINIQYTVKLKKVNNAHKMYIVIEEYRYRDKIWQSIPCKIILLNDTSNVSYISYTVM